MSVGATRVRGVSAVGATRARPALDIRTKSPGKEQDRPGGGRGGGESSWRGKLHDYPLAGP